jgi:hypothetical protein
MKRTGEAEVLWKDFFFNGQFLWAIFCFDFGFEFGSWSGVDDLCLESIWMSVSSRHVECSVRRGGAICASLAQLSLLLVNCRLFK